MQDSICRGNPEKITRKNFIETLSIGLASMVMTIPVFADSFGRISLDGNGDGVTDAQFDSRDYITRPESSKENNIVLWNDDRKVKDDGYSISDISEAELSGTIVSADYKIVPNMAQHKGLKKEITDYESKINSDFSKFKADTNADVKKYKEETNADIKKFKEDTTSNVSKYQADTDAGIEAYKGIIDKDIADYKTNTDASLKTFKDNLTKDNTNYKTGLTSDFETYKTNTTKVVSDYQANTTKIVDDYKTATNKDISDYKTSINTEFETVKKSVGDSKKLVADAITAKGISTTIEDSFETMATRIKTLYSQEQYDANYNNGRTQGLNDIKNKPSDYGLQKEVDWSKVHMVSQTNNVNYSSHHFTYTAPAYMPMVKLNGGFSIRTSLFSGMNCYVSTNKKGTLWSWYPVPSSSWNDFGSSMNINISMEKGEVLTVHFSGDEGQIASWTRSGSYNFAGFYIDGYEP